MPKPARNSLVKTPAPTVAKAGSPQQPVRPTAASSWPNAKVEAKPSVSTSPAAGSQPTREAIAEAAYFLWLKRGGSEVLNWLEAEAALRAKTRIAV